MDDVIKTNPKLLPVTSCEEVLSDIDIFFSGQDVEEYCSISDTASVGFCVGDRRLDVEIAVASSSALSELVLP